ncbi:Putative O-methyltransferase domain, S-adenosyl-L-methionine-dependent methyltransferase superfamily [Colletotrichum destructivum]|uniref:O-methyltransferase domain, S-adenosyl-L-methionine-dependent methyltransferase superfamily n=1 Tax=Colletotrichum destructivum TaxID=34406 RepID=A0AAX4IV19_9PEZI|nr:Putative O-methyltransferase domain, S-adenosyl-L-methionine-dependent methyltransferase superfamily [Colletotrichum destructivum]
MTQHIVIQQLDNLLSQVKALDLSSLGPSDRAKAQQSLVEALSTAETPYEHLLRLSGSHLHLACLRLGADISLFKTLSESEKPLSVDYLGKQLGIAPDLLERVLRFLASVGTVKQTSKDTYAPDKISHAMASLGLDSGVHLLFDIHDKTYQALPDAVAELGYKDVDDIRNGVFQKAFGTDLSCYEYLVHHPELQGYMQDAMKLQPPDGDWLAALPVDKEVAQWQASDPERVLFVDIGGGMGHQCLRLRERYPDAPGRVIVQDMPITIGRIPKPMPHGVEAMAHSFDDPQPIKNAKFYYLRNVLHGLPYDHSVSVLKKLAASMGAESRLVIDDLVVPDEGACRQACQLDFIMMASIAGRKRTKTQWYTLLEAAGFKILDIHTYSWPLQDSLIIASPVHLS